MSSPPGKRTGLALCVVFVLALYWPASSGQGFFFERDVWLYWVPHIEWAARTMAMGQMPQWLPFRGFGAPFMADPSFQFFYPPTLITWIMPAHVAYSVLVLAHSVLGAVGMYTLLRRRVRSFPAALMGAVVFVGSGPIVSSSNLWHHFCSAMYIPWVVDAFLRLRRGRGSVMRLGLMTGLQALAGSADVCVMTGATLVALFPHRVKRLKRLMPRLAASVVVCVLLAAAQWVPTILLARNAGRSALDLQGRLHWSVPPSSLIDFVVPLSGSAHSVEDEPTEESLRLVQWMYFGASTLPLILIGFRRAPRVGGLLVFTLVLSLGRHTPLGSLAASLPIVSMFRFPSKLLWILSAGWASLAAIGLASLRSGNLDRKRNLPVMGFGLAILSSGLFLAIRLGSNTADGNGLPPLAWGAIALGGSLLALASGTRSSPGLLGLIVVFDLIIPAQSYNAYAPARMFVTKPSIVDELRNQGARRIFVRQDSRRGDELLKTPAEWSQKQAYYFALGQMVVPPQSVRWDLRGSYDGDFTGLASIEEAAVSSRVLGEAGVDPKWLALAGVTHVVQLGSTGRGATATGLQNVGSVPTFFEYPAQILSVPEPLSLAFLVTRIRTEASWDGAMATLTDPGFNARTEAVRLGSSAIAARATNGVSPGVVQIEQDEPGHMVIRTKVAAPATLVVLNAFAKGWSARVDGVPHDVLRANLMFQSVDLSEGDHVVELNYQTPGLALGLALSAIGWAWMALQMTGPRKPRKSA